MTKNNFKKDYFWNTTGTLLQNLISPLLLVVVTRLNGVDDSGIFSFAFSIAMVFWVFGMWGGRTYQVSDIRRKFSHHSYLVVRLMLAGVMLVGSIVFALINDYDLVKSGILITLVTLKAIESIADTLYGVMQSNNSLYISGKSLMYKAVFGGAAFVLADVLTGSLLLGCIAILVINILFLLAYDLPKTNRLESVWFKVDQAPRYVNQAISIMKVCAPVFVVMFLAMFSLNIPRYFVDLYHQNDIAYFGIIAMPITLIVLLMSFILQPNIVHLSKLYENKKYINFNKIVVKIVSLTTAIGLITLLATATIGVPVLDIVFGIEFSQHHLDLVIIVAGGVINAIVSIFINVLIVMRRMRQQLGVLILTNIMLVLCSLLLIPQYGLSGGVGLFGIVNAIQLVFLVLIYNAALKGSRDAKKN